MQAANEVGVPLKDNGYNGDLTSRQAGSVGGQMVKKMSSKQRIGNHYYIPSSNALIMQLCRLSLPTKRQLRRNVTQEVVFEVRVGG